ncbi:MAG: RNA 2'-phosphotransferase, partial [bacterium]|nr:RNA 2'-phosphotransferase [bacterium]
GTQAAEGRRRHVHFVPFPVGDHRVVSGARDSANVHVYCNKWAVYGQIPWWLSSSLAVLTPETGPWDCIELVVFAHGAMRRTMYDAALAQFPLDGIPDEVLRYEKGRREERSTKASRTYGPPGEARPLAPSASGAYGSTGDSPTMSDEDMAVAVVGTLSQEGIDEQRRRFAELELCQQGRGSQSTRAVDWAEHYADDPDDPCCPEDAPDSAALGGAAGRGRPLSRQPSARGSGVSPHASPRSTAHGRAAGAAGSGAQGPTAGAHRSRSRRGRQASGTQGTTGFATPAQVRPRSPSGGAEPGSGSDGDHWEQGTRFYRYAGRRWYGRIVWCPVCDRPLRAGCLECLYPDCHAHLSYDIGAEVESADDHRQEAAVAAATRLSETCSAAVIGGLPVVSGSRGRNITRGIRKLRSEEGQRKDNVRKLQKYQLEWDTKEWYRLHKARQGCTRDCSRYGHLRPWVPRSADDVFPGEGVLAEYSPKSRGLPPQPARERTCAAARAKVEQFAQARTAWPKDLRGRYSM